MLMLYLGHRPRTCTGRRLSAVRSKTLLVQEPCTVVSIDLYGELPKGKDGMVYVLSMQCPMSRYCAFAALYKPNFEPWIETVEYRELPRIVPELRALVPQAAASLRGLPCADRLRRTTYFPLRSE